MKNYPQADRGQPDSRQEHEYYAAEMAGFDSDKDISDIEADMALLLL